MHALSCQLVVRKLKFMSKNHLPKLKGWHHLLVVFLFVAGPILTHLSWKQWKRSLIGCIWYPLLTFYLLYSRNGKITSERTSFPHLFSLRGVFKGILWLINLHLTYRRIYWKDLTSGILKRMVNLIAQNALKKAAGCV